MQGSHMPAMLMPAVHSYFAIYTLEGQPPSLAMRGLNWDLHATATDKTMAISHARMLALQPGICEVHVKQVVEDLTSGLVSVKDIMRCKRGQVANWMIAGGAITTLAAIAAMLTLVF